MVIVATVEQVSLQNIASITPISRISSMLSLFHSHACFVGLCYIFPSFLKLSIKYGFAYLNLVIDDPYDSCQWPQAGRRPSGKPSASNWASLNPSRLAARPPVRAYQARHAGSRREENTPADLDPAGGRRLQKACPRSTEHRRGTGNRPNGAAERGPLPATSARPSRGTDLRPSHCWVGEPGGGQAVGSGGGIAGPGAA